MSIKNKKKNAPSFRFEWDSISQVKGKALVLGKRKSKLSAATKTLQDVKTASVALKTKDLPGKSLANLQKSPQNIEKPPQIIQKHSQNHQKPSQTPQNPPESLKTSVAVNKVQETRKEVHKSPPMLNKSGPIGHIKRKQKKDKLIAKQLQQEGKKTSDVRLGNKEQSYNNLFSVRQKDIYVNTSAGKSVSEKVFTTCPFKDMDIHPHLVSNLEKHGFEKSTNVQSKAIPVIVSGKNTLVRSQTGSGKTLAYAVPIIDALQSIQPRIKRSDGIQAIIVVPTRELALQVHELFTKINTFQWLVVSHICGGENRKTEKDRIKKGMSVVIGTPGRLLDHVLHTAAMKIANVRCLVLDEADRLLDMGFRKDIISLVEALDKSKTNSEYDPIAILKSTSDKTDDKPLENHPEHDLKAPLKNLTSKLRQNIMLSATLTKAVSELASFTMKDHIFIEALDLKSNAVADSYVIPDTVQQEFIMTHAKHRLFTLAALLFAKTRKERCKLFVFMASTQMVDFHYDLFRKYLLKMPANRGRDVLVNKEEDEEEEEEEEEEVVMDTELFKLHGSMDQKERKVVFKGFRDATKGILICTDVVARGIDVPAADCIIQYTGPQMDEDYLHRVGRTGRAGQSGSAIIFLTHEEQEYIDHLRTHRVFLKKRDHEEFLKELTVVMEEPNKEQAATLLQRHLEAAVERDSALGRSACFAYSTWSRFYNSYPAKMRKFFDFKRANLGHYVTSFALRLTPTQVARVVRGEVADIVAPRLNKKLANHRDNPELVRKSSALIGGKLAKKTISLTTSEFSSGLEPLRKKKRTQD